MTEPFRALLIGCGNIGALYDWDVPDVLTHAKAYQTFDIPFDVVDLDSVKATRVAARYGGRAFGDLGQADLSRYRAVSICSDTGQHTAHLQAVLEAGTPLVFLEKPVALNAGELRRLMTLQSASRSQVLVNYLRRFLPAYARLRERIGTWGPAVELQSVVVRYQRGFVNNGSHALDLLEYLFDREVVLDEFAAVSSVADAFPDDPTVTGILALGAAPVVLVGFPTASYGLFELELNFNDRRVHIADRGDRIDYYFNAPEQDGRLALTESEEHCLKNYMLPFFEHGLRATDTASSAGNFQSAARLNLRMLAALDQISRRVCS